MRLTISHLEQLSGVPVHTIRMWERRYHALEPSRTAGNTRFYNDDHIKRLLNIVSLNQAGLKISQACALSPSQVDEYLERDMDAIITSDAKFGYYISQLLKHGLSYDEQSFDALLKTCVSEFGVANSYQEVIIPLLQRLGMMWRRDQICTPQEHFLSAVIRQKLMVAIDNIPLESQQKPTWLLFLPEDEAHDIPLLFASYLLRTHGFKVIYLGEKVPLTTVSDVFEKNNVSRMLFFMVRQRPIEEANSYLTFMNTNFADTPMWLAGNSNLIANLNIGENITWVKTITDFSQLIKIAASAE